MPLIYNQAKEHYIESVKLQELRENMDRQGFKNVSYGTKVKIDTTSKVKVDKLLINRIEGIN